MDEVKNVPTDDELEIKTVWLTWEIVEDVKDLLTIHDTREGAEAFVQENCSGHGVVRIEWWLVNSDIGFRSTVA